MITQLINKIIFGREKFCRLCFTKVYDDDLRFHDEVALNSNIEKISSMLADILGEKYTCSMDVHDIFCSNCIELLKNSYNFIRMCKINSEHLENTIDVLNDSLQITTLNLRKSKSILIQFDASDYTFMQFFQYRKPNEITEPDSPEIKKKIIKDRAKIQTITPARVLAKKLEKRAKSLISGSRKHILKMNLNRPKIPDIESNPKISNEEKREEPIKTVAQLRRSVRSQKPTQSNDNESSVKDIHNKISKKPSIIKDKKQTDEYKCMKCGKTFNSFSRLTHHKKKAHVIYKSYYCAGCNVTVFSYEEQQKHIREHPACLKCDLCDVKFRSEYSLATHRKLHFKSDSQYYIGLKTPYVPVIEDEDSST